MTKLRTLLFAISFLLFQSVMNAQARFGILAGPHSASIFESNSAAWSDNIKSYYSARFSFHAGVTGDIPFSSKSPLYFQPGLIYSAKGRKFSTPSSPDLLAAETQGVKFVHQQQFLNYLDIPLNLVLKFPIGKDSRFIFGGGPKPTLLIGGKETTIVEDVTADGAPLKAGDTNKPNDGAGTYKKMDFSLNALIGFEIGQFFITVNYDRSFGAFYTPRDYSENKSFRHNIIGGTVGLFFGKSKTAKAKDTDKDGVLDINDQCPNVAGPSFLNGCPDKDGDGIADKNDKCPDVKGPADNNGCPYPDKDNDGVPDNVDKCPNVAGLQIYEGCPIPDKDNDGVNDFEDRCPTIPGPASNKGCPIADADKDGVADKDDKCPNVPGLEKYAGCPIPDTDGDGLNDEEDKCPTAKGTKENSGCPVIKKEITDQILAAAEQVKFVNQKADLQNSSNKILDQVVKLMKQNPSLMLTISNYTNILPTKAANQKLAVERANNVMAYIGLQGVDWSRMKAYGFGTDPVPPTPAGTKNPGNRTEFSVLK